MHLFKSFSSLVFVVANKWFIAIRITLVLTALTSSYTIYAIDRDDENSATDEPADAPDLDVTERLRHLIELPNPTPSDLQAFRDELHISELRPEDLRRLFMYATFRVPANALASYLAAFREVSPRLGKSEVGTDEMIDLHVYFALGYFTNSGVQRPTLECLAARIALRDLEYERSQFDEVETAAFINNGNSLSSSEVENRLAHGGANCDERELETHGSSNFVFCDGDAVTEDVTCPAGWLPIQKGQLQLDISRFGDSAVGCEFRRDVTPYLPPEKDMARLRSLCKDADESGSSRFDVEVHGAYRSYACRTSERIDNPPKCAQGFVPYRDMDWLDEDGDGGVVGRAHILGCTDVAFRVPVTLSGWSLDYYKERMADYEIAKAEVLERYETMVAFGFDLSPATCGVTMPSPHISARGFVTNIDGLNLNDVKDDSHLSALTYVVTKAGQDWAVFRATEQNNKKCTKAEFASLVRRAIRKLPDARGVLLDGYEAPCGVLISRAARLPVAERFWRILKMAGSEPDRDWLRVEFETLRSEYFPPR